MDDKVSLYTSRYFTFFVTLVIFAGFLFAFMLKRIDLAIRGLSIAIPVLFSLLFSHHFLSTSLNFKNKIFYFSFNPKHLFFIYIIIYLSSISILIFSGVREWTYILCLLILYVLIFIQIFSEGLKPKLLLLEILMLQMNLIYGVTLRYPLYFGGTDLLVHTYLSQITYSLGHVVPVNFSLYYSYFPLYHIFMAQSSYLLGTDIQTSMFLVSCPIFVVAILFLYLIVYNLVEDSQFSLLCCLLFATNSNTMYSGTYVVTRTFAFVGFLALLYLLYIKADFQKKVIFKMLSLLMCLFIILVHQVSITQIVILIIILSLCELLINKKKYINSNFIFFLISLFLSYWIYTAYLFTRSILSNRVRPEYFEKIVLLSNIGSVDEWIYLLTNIHVSVFVFFAIIGIRSMLLSKKSEYFQVLGLFSLSMLILYIPSPLQTLWQFINLFSFDRFSLFLSPFMAISMGFGIFMYYKHFNPKLNRIYSIVPLFLFLLLTATSLLYSISDSHDLFINSGDAYFNEREVQGLNYVSNHVKFGSEIYSDYAVNRYFIQEDLNYSNLTLPYFISIGVNPIELFDNSSGYVFLREEQLSKKGLKFENKDHVTLYRNTPPNIHNLYRTLAKTNRIYSNSAITLYL